MNVNPSSISLSITAFCAFTTFGLKFEANQRADIVTAVSPIGCGINKILEVDVEGAKCKLVIFKVK